MIIYTGIILFLTTLYLFIFLFYLLGWLTLPDFPDTDELGSTRVSIIIAARNEAQHIQSILSDLLNQSYPASLFEVWVVDDFSSDKTVSIVQSIEADNLKLLQLKDVLEDDVNAVSGKKKALQYGINNASGELIITTDADCSMNSEWLRTLVNFYEITSCHMIVAPVSFKDEKTFFERLQSLDFIGLIGITAATLQWNFPTMCNGANLAFRKKSFEEVNGYYGIDSVSSGDDLLLMHKIAHRWKKGVRFLKNRNAIVYTDPQHDLKGFLNQRIRWTSKSKVYTDKRIIFNLLVVYFFNVSILVNVALLFFNRVYFLLLAFQFILKIIVELAFLSQSARFFNRQKLLSLFLPAQFFHVFYIVIVGALGNFLKPKWKGRRIS